MDKEIKERRSKEAFLDLEHLTFSQARLANNEHMRVASDSEFVFVFAIFLVTTKERQCQS